MPKATVGRGRLAPHTDAQPEPTKAVTKPATPPPAPTNQTRPATSYLGKAPAAPPPPAPPAAEPAADLKIPEWQAQQLVDNGFDPKDFSSPDLATKVLTRLAARPSPVFAPQQATPPQPSAPQQPEQFDPWNGVDRTAITAEFGEHGAKLMGVIDKIHANSQQQLIQARQQLAAVHGHLAHSVTQQLDASFAALDKLYPGAFGTAPMAALDQFSPQAQQRKQVTELASRIIASGLAHDIHSANEMAAERVLGKRGSRQAEAMANDRYSQTVGFSERSLPRGENVSQKRAFLAEAQEIAAGG